MSFRVLFTIVFVLSQYVFFAQHFLAEFTLQLFLGGRRVDDLVSFEQGFGFVALSALVTLEKDRILVKLHVPGTCRSSGKCFRARLAIEATYDVYFFSMLLVSFLG